MYNKSFLPSLNNRLIDFYFIPNKRQYKHVYKDMHDSPKYPFSFSTKNKGHVVMSHFLILYPHANKSSGKKSRFVSNHSIIFHLKC